VVSLKKFKQALFFIIPLVVLTVLPVVIFAFTQHDAFLIGNMYCLKLLFGDSIFWVAVFNTYGKAFLFSFIAVLVFTVIRLLVKCGPLNNIKIYHLINAALASIISFAILLVEKIKWFGWETGEYDGHSLLVTTPTIRLPITVFEVIAALQMGVLIAFVFWLIELLVRFVKRKKAEKQENRQL